MKKLRLYQYAKCDTCRKALKYLENKQMPVEILDLYSVAPTLPELKQMLKAVGGEVKKLFNTSGVVYREQKIGQKLPTLSESEALKLLASEGKLVKRPFLLLGDGGLVGFRTEEWDKAFSK